MAIQIKRLHPIVIEIKGLTKEIVEWYRSIGGKVYSDQIWDFKGRQIDVHYVGYGKGKFCHHRRDGTVGVRLHFNEEDAKIATMFIMQFHEFVEAHNIEELHFN